MHVTRFARRRATALFAVAFAVGTVACDRPPSADGLAEWTPQDHDHPASGAPPQGQSPGKPRSSGDEATQLAELTWTTQCAQCHGPTGHGDGPSGPMVKAPDLTRVDWQDRVKDEEIAATIHAGKGQMPKFDLSDAVVGGLVKRIRKSRGAP